MMTEDYVSDKEELYRSVRKDINADEYRYDDGELVITSQAFRDSQREPSVDRAKLRDFDPNKSRIDKGDGVVSLIAKDVRQIGDVKSKTENDETKHAVDIKPDPVSNNEAHALITVQPEFFGSQSKQKKSFKLLRIALARLATENGWTIEPKIS